MSSPDNDGESPQPNAFETADADLMAFLREMYEAHGAHVHWVDDWIAVDGGKLKVQASWSRYSQHSEQVVVQTDIITVLSSGEEIVESLVGIGTDFKSALMAACENFSATLHVLVAAVLNKPCDHALQERWLIAGKERSVTLGMPQFRGAMRLEAWPAIFQAIKAQLKGSSISTGLHWLRYYYGHFSDQPSAIEVLLDNEPDLAAQKEMSYFPRPASDVFYSVRLFLVIQDL